MLRSSLDDGSCRGLALLGSTFLMCGVKCSKPSPGEEVLLHALRQSRRNILRLEELKDSIEGSIEIETKQFERIQFGLKRATADAAFIRTLQKLRKQSQQPQE